MKRIIHVMGSEHGFFNSLAEGDAPVPFLNWAKFKNPANIGFENINIEIQGAFHNDFSYNEDQYKNLDLNDDKAVERERINRRTNLFMRRLYEAAYADQTKHGFLDQFFLSLERSNAAEKVNGIWRIDPDYLKDF